MISLLVHHSCRESRVCYSVQSPLYVLQLYVSSVLDVVDGAVGDADSISADLRQMDAILNTDINATDITANIAVSLKY